MDSLGHFPIAVSLQIVLFPSQFKARDVKVSILDFAVIVQVLDLGRDECSASFASSNVFDVQNLEVSHAVGFDFAFSFVQINDIFAVQGFNDCFFLGTKKGDEVFFGDEVFHSVVLVTG
jgi:hypothetical protein